MMTEEEQKIVLAALKEIADARMPGQARRIAVVTLSRISKK